MMDDIENGATVYFGEFNSKFTSELIAKETPESIVISKNLIQSLSKEANTMISLIINAPNELFFDGGKIKIRKIRGILREKYKYSWRVIKACEIEIKSKLKNS
jgi:hypothetical protein